MLFISDFIALYSWFKHEYLKRNLISLCYHGLIIHLAKKVCIGLIWGTFSISLVFFSQFWAQISPIYSHRTSTFLTKGLLYIFFFGNLNSYEHITRFYKNTRIYQQKNIISTFSGTGGHFPDFQLTLSQFAPFQFSLARVIVHFIFIKLNLYTHLSQF